MRPIRNPFYSALLEKREEMAEQIYIALIAKEYTQPTNTDLLTEHLEYIKRLAKVAASTYYREEKK